MFFPTEQDIGLGSLVTVRFDSDFDGPVSLRGFTADFGDNWLYVYNVLPISYILQFSV